MKSYFLVYTVNSIIKSCNTHKVSGEIKNIQSKSQEVSTEIQTNWCWQMLIAKGFQQLKYSAVVSNDIQNIQRCTYPQ